MSPIAYVMLVVFLAVLGCRFYLTLKQLTQTGPRGVEYPLQFLFSIFPRGTENSNEWVADLLSGVAFWLVYLLIPPLLTMRLFAEERSTGTLEMLMTAPLRDWQVVLSKYFACFVFYVVLWLPTLIYLPVLLNLHDPVWRFPSPLGDLAWTEWSILLVSGLGGMVLAVLLVLPRFGTVFRVVALVLFLGGAICTAVGLWGHYRYDSEHLYWVDGNDPMPVLSAYLGLLLAGSMFLALGMLVSSLVRSQMVAALLAVVLSLGFILAGIVRLFLDAGSPLQQVLYSFSVPLHISNDFGRGLVDTRHVVLYSSVALFCLFLTVRSLESRRWR